LTLKLQSRQGVRRFCKADYLFLSVEESGNNSLGSYTITIWQDEFNTISTAATISADSISEVGHIGWQGDTSDWYGISLTSGTLYQIDVIGLAGDGTLAGLTLADPWLALRSSTGSFIIADDDSGLDLNSRIYYTPTSSGKYYLDIQESGANESGTYQVIVNSIPTTTTISTEAPQTGSIDFNGDSDLFNITLSAGVSYGFSVDGITLVDPFLEILDGTGSVVSYDDDSGSGLSAQVIYTPVTSGTYFLSARESGNNSTGSYNSRVWQLPTVSIRDATVMEGNSGTRSLDFVISLSNPSPVDVTLTVGTRASTASTASGDYQGIWATPLVIPAGATSATFSVPVNGDTLFEPNEGLRAVVADASMAIIGDGEARGWVNDDDAPYALPTDWLLPYQWHLYPGTGVNVLPVWTSWRGAGVKVGVFDQGIDPNHSDLDGNLLTSLGRNASTLLFGGSPVLISDKHGTAVAGVIAAEIDEELTVGIAPEAILVSIYTPFGRNLTDSASDIVNAYTYAKSLDVLNDSWGFAPQGDADFSTVPWAMRDNFRSSTFIEAGTALQSLAELGRSGLGTIVVQSAGNSYSIGDDTNLHNFQNSRYIITVAATDYSGSPTYYSSPGASVLIAAPGGETIDDPLGGIITSDRVGIDGYSSLDWYFAQGTSFSAPVVSGIVALMLEANPGLGYRDVQQILAYTARLTAETGNDWRYNSGGNWNGGGLHYDAVLHNLGFGLVDALAAVRLAETWTMGPLTSANDLEVTATRNLPQSIPDGTSLLQQSVDISSGIEVERVEVTVNLTHPFIGDLSILLTSPSGTNSWLLWRAGQGALSAFGQSQANIDFTFNTVLSMGESGAGTWTLTVFDMAAGYVGQLNSWTLNLIGKPDSADDVYIYTNEFAESAADQAGRATLTDASGTDTLNAAAVTGAMTIDLAPGAVSTIDGRPLTIASGTTIENAIGGDGADMIRGNAADNMLRGMRGNDSLDGGGGSDRMIGGAGNDTFGWDPALRGGDDTMDGGPGDDTYVVGAGDQVIELANDGIDTIWTDVNAALLDLPEVENLFLFGQSTVSAAGNANPNRLKGNDLSNSLNGLGGNDTLEGGTGNDSLDGGNGDDRLIGGAGNDTFDWDPAQRDGADTMEGGTGDDTYVLSAGDVVIELGDGGTDTIWSTPSNSLQDLPEVENLFLYGSAALNASGNSKANRLSGNDQANVLSGQGGNDTLEGGLGNDSLIGGAGLDTATFSGARKDYTIAWDAASSRLNVSSVSEGADQLIDIETLTFADATYALSLFQTPSAPTLGSISTLSGGSEDTALTITYAAVAAAADEADAQGDRISFRVEAVSSGTLTKGGVAVTAGSTTLADGESLVWTPAANADGILDAFTVTAVDGTPVSGTAVPVRVQVASVNDAPSTLGRWLAHKSPEVLWTKLFGSALFDEANAIELGQSGEIYLLGNATTTAPDGQIGPTHDYFITRFSAEGGIEWNVNLGLHYDDEATSIAYSPDGSIYVVGYTGYDLENQVNQGSLDGFLIKYDNLGNRIWSKLLSSTEQDETFGVATDKDGNIIVTGQTRGGQLQGSEYSIGSGPIYVQKFNSDGTILWTSQSGGNPGGEFPTDLTVDSNGNIYVVGSTAYDLNGQANSGSYDTFVIKYNQDGSTAWTKLIGSESGDIGKSIAHDNNGDIYILGLTSTGVDGQPPIGGIDAFATKLSANGEKIWTRTLGSTESDDASSISVCADGSVLVVGTSAAGIDNKTAIGSSDAFIYQILPDGSQGFTTLIGTEWGEAGNAIAINDSGQAYIAGSTRGDLGNQLNANGGVAQSSYMPDEPAIRTMDGFLMKLSTQDTTVFRSESILINEDGNKSGFLIATDADNDTLTYFKVAGPTHGSVTIDPTTGEYAYNPTVNFNGTDSFSFKVNDGALDSPVATVSINVAAVNDAPVITSDAQTANMVEDTNLTATGQVAAIDVDDGASLTFSTVDNAQYGSFVVDTATGQWTYTLNNGANGVEGPVQSLAQGRTLTESFTVTVADELGATDSQLVSVNITGTDDVAALSSDSKSLTETNAVLSTGGTLTLSDLDTTDATVVAQTDTTGTYGKFSINAAGAWSYATNDAVNQLDAGQVVAETFNVATSDGGSATVTVTITGTNDVATLSSDSKLLAETNAVLSTSGTLILSDLDTTDATVVAQTDTAGTYGKFSINAAGAWSYATNDAVNQLDAGQVVIETFSVATTGGGSASVTINITGSNDEATLSSDTQSLSETDAVLSTSGTLTLSDLDATDATVVAQTNTAGTYGKFSINAAGAWSYATNDAVNQLDAGQVVTETFNVATTDGGTATVAVNITGANDVATLSSDTQALTETDAVLYTSGTLTVSDLDTTDATVIAQTDTAGTFGKFSINAAGAWSYSTNDAVNQLDAGQMVTETFNVATTDGGTATVAVNITGSQDVATLSSATQGLTETNAVLSSSGTLTLTDLDATDATVVAQTDAAGIYGKFSINAAGAWSYATNDAVNQLDAGQVVTETFSVATTDGGSSTVTITITGSNDIASLTSDSKSLTETNAVLSTSGTLTLSDLDATDATVVAQTDMAGTYGKFSIDAAGAWSYATNDAVNQLDAGQVVSEEFTVATSDSGSAKVTITITGSNDVATLTSATTSLTETDAVLSTSGQLTLSDLDTTDATVTAQTDKAGTYGKFSIASTGVWSYATNDAVNQLDAEQVVTETFSVATTDGGSATVTVNITGTNDVATLSSVTQALTETDTVLSTSGTLTLNDLDATEATMVAQTDTTGAYGKFSIGTNGAWSYATNTAVNQLDAGQVVTETFSVATSDGGSSTVTINITGSNDIASLTSASQALTETDAVLSTSGTLTLSDLDATEATVVAQTDTAGNYGKFSINTSGAWSYATNNAVNQLDAGQVVTEAFNVATTDGGSSTVTINITGSEDVATLSSATQALTETDAALITSGTLTLTDPDATDATVVGQTDTAGNYGKFSINAAGAWIYATNDAVSQLDAGQVVTETFNVATTDGDSASVTVNLTGSNDLASLTSDSKSLTETNAVLSTSGTLTLTDLDTTDATVVAQTDSAGTYGKFSIDSAGAWSYATNDAVNQLDAGQVVTETFSVATTDGGSATVTVNITGSQDVANLQVQTYLWKSHGLVAGVELTAAGQTIATDTDGAAVLELPMNSSSGLEASKSLSTTDQSTANASVNLQDAIAILKMIVGLDVNGAGKPLSPYQSLAADFDGNGTVSLTDAIGVLKHVVGLSAPAPVLKFVDESSTSVAAITTKPLNPGQPPAISVDTTGADTVHLGLVGYLSGDVDGSYTGGATSALPLTYFDPLIANGISPAQFGIYGV
jgi:VCBS repeat-containing protein